jgi:hypothetical protein
MNVIIRSLIIKFLLTSLFLPPAGKTRQREEKHPSLTKRG